MEHHHAELRHSGLACVVEALGTWSCVAEPQLWCRTAPRRHGMARHTTLCHRGSTWHVELRHEELVHAVDVRHVELHHGGSVCRTVPRRLSSAELCHGGSAHGAVSPSAPPCPQYLSISVHHRMSSFSFMKTGKCWSLPCLMELERVVMVLTLLNCKRHRLIVTGCDIQGQCHPQGHRRHQNPRRCGKDPVIPMG